MAEPGKLLLVDDDPTFCRVMARALARRGFEVHQAGCAADAIRHARQAMPGHAIVDLNMPGDSGLQLIPELVAVNPAMRIVVLTGYASIATAVEAIKLGAIHYLTKPADADEVLNAFAQESGDTRVPVTKQPLPLGRLEWEHIQRVLKECDGSISETARRLGMHRRTLQRKLQKRPRQS